MPSGETGQQSAAGAVELLSGPAPGTTTLACVSASFVDRWPARPVSVTKLLAAVPGPVVHVRLAGSLGEARTALSALGWPATDVSPSAGAPGGSGASRAATPMTTRLKLWVASHECCPQRCVPGPHAGLLRSDRLCLSAFTLLKQLLPATWPFTAYQYTRCGTEVPRAKGQMCNCN